MLKVQDSFCLHAVSKNSVAFPISILWTCSLVNNASPVNQEVSLSAGLNALSTAKEYLQRANSSVSSFTTTLSNSGTGFEISQPMSVGLVLRRAKVNACLASQPVIFGGVTSPSSSTTHF